MGTESAKAWATPLKAFSDPGPHWTKVIPFFKPKEALVNPSAIFTATRSVLACMVLIFSEATVSNKGLDGKPVTKSTPSFFSIFAMAVFTFSLFYSFHLIENLHS
jgi:hypothetical protein